MTATRERAAARAIVFLGPTLAVADAERVLDADYRPPAAQGDLYRAALERPTAIGLVDGYFARVPAVWHKEILWAMRHGVHVFGSASMGALRAAELAPFGMEGVGEIFADYRDGRCEADDEVAVAHGSVDSGYRSVSEALVTIRATLRRAAADEVVAADVAATLIEIARELYYPERSFPRILAVGAERGVDRFALDALRTWLPGGRVDRKRLDALAMLGRMCERLTEGLAPKVVSYTLEDTQVWAQARSLLGAGPVVSGSAPSSFAPFELVTDELRLAGGPAEASSYRAAYKEALLRHLMLDAADRLGFEPAIEEVAASRERLVAVVRGDLDTGGLPSMELDRLARENARLRLVEAHCYADTLRRLPDHLLTTGRYGTAARTARRKAALLADRAGQLPTLAELGLDADQLFGWFFETRRGEPVPADLDRHARSAGFASADAFRRAALLDYLDAQEAHDDRV